MKSTFLFVPTFIALCCLDSALAISRETLDEWTAKYDIIDLDHESIFKDRGSVQPFTLSAQRSFGSDITLEVKSNDRLFADRRPEVLDEDFFEGTVLGEEDSAVTITVWQAGLTGRISLVGSDNRRQTIHVDHLDGTKQTVLYNERDMKRTANGGFVDDEVSNGPAVAGEISDVYGDLRVSPQVERLPAKLAKRQSRSVKKPKRRCKMVVAADSSFIAEFGEKSIKHMVSIMQDVRQIYRRELGVSLRVQAAFLDDDDHLGLGDIGISRQGVASDLLNAFSDAVGRNQIPLDDDVCLSHLFVSRRLGSSLGVAFTASDDPNVVGGICSGSSAVGVSTQLGRNGRQIPLSAVVTTVAHEVGHGFGAPHDENTDCSGDNAIMAAAVRTDESPVEEFSTCTRQAISRVLAAKGTCLG